MASTRVIGLDIGSSAVRAAELDFAGGARAGKAAPTLMRTGEVALPPGAVRDGEVIRPEVVSGALRQLWQEARFDSKDVVIGVGNQRVLVRDLDLPWMPLHQLKSSLPFHVAEMLPMSSDEALLDYHPLAEFDGPQGRTIHGMLVAAQRDTVNANIHAAEDAGLRPLMVDLNGFALLRSLAHGELHGATVAFVDIGATVTTVVVAAQGDPRLVRNLPSGGQNVTNSIASAASVQPADAERLKREIGIGFAVAPEHASAAEAIGTVVRTLVEGIRNTLVYYAGNNPGAGIDVIVLTGGGSHLPGLGQYLSSASRLPVNLGDPLAPLRLAKSLNRQTLAGRESALAIPIGLAYGVAA